MTKIETINEAVKQSRKAAEAAYANQMRAAKSPAMAAFQQRQITEEEYEVLVGETYPESLKEMYDAELMASLERMNNRVAAGYITPGQYETITGKKYEEDV